MNTFTNALLATSVFGSSLMKHETLELPGDLCCRFFRQRNYDNALQFDEYCITDLSHENNYRIDAGVQINSYICGKNVAVDACDSPLEQRDLLSCNIMSAGLVMNPDADTSYGYGVWIDMEYYNPAINGAVTTFADEDCTGHADRYFGAPNYPQEAFYKVKDYQLQRASSVHVPYGYTFITYSDKSFNTPLEIISGDYDDHELQKPKCQNITHLYINHKVHGLIIDEKGVEGWKVIKNHDLQNPDPAVGFWKSLLVSTESQEFEYHVGVSNTQSSGSSSENAASSESSTEGFMEMTASQYIELAISNGIAASVSVGGAFKMFEFGASSEYEHTQTDTSGSSQEVSTGTAWGQAQGVSSLVAQDVQVSMQEDYGVVHKTTCRTESKKTGAGLYQFVLMTSDGKASLSTSHLVCRTGEHWNTPPACTWDACKNADCTCCEGDTTC